MIRLRSAKKEDITKIDELYVNGSIREGKLQFPKASVATMKKELERYKKVRQKNFLKEVSSKKQQWIVAEEKNVLVGFGQAWIKTKEIGMLEKIYVDKNHSRKGIGLKLLKKLEQWLINRKVKFIEAGIYYKNKPSIKLNEKAGFKPISIKMRKKIQ
jgi:L-amino acid N-acyltransferase YncA|tara:strand:- start:203 stop:673 length:471 start_codon:yes stop_codon:yes gene_type:complete